MEKRLALLNGINNNQKNFVEMMDGQIRVKSTVGSGSNFTVLFPLLKDYKQLEVQKVDEVNNEKIIEKDFALEFKPTLLVVDNDESSRDIIKLFLKDVCNADFVDSGEKAFRTINEKQYDIMMKKTRHIKRSFIFFNLIYKML